MRDFAFDFDPSKCQQCGGKCCRGESGYIFVSIKEMEVIAEFLGLSLDDLIAKYVKKVGYRFSFLEKNLLKEWACIFFDEGRCSIYEVRPKQCREFPFWQAYLDPKNLPQLLEECIGVSAKQGVLDD